MRLSAHPARIAGVLLLALGVFADFSNNRPASATSGADGELHAPAQRATTTRGPVLFDGNYYGWASPNWSGDAVTAGPYKAVTGSWAVPTVAPTRGPTYSSVWAGIDGFDNGDLIQSGIDADSAHGTTSYFPWWTTNEAGFVPQTAWTSLSCVSPCSGAPAAFTVSPGDTMTVAINETGPDTWSITLKDTTNGIGGTETGIAHSASGGASGGDSAEWIVERPAFVNRQGRLRFTTLADYGTVTVDHGTANGSSPDLVANSANSDAGLMVQRAATVISTPSGPDADAKPDGFAIAYGSTAPPSPAS
jgi:hypothetical protein